MARSHRGAPPLMAHARQRVRKTGTFWLFVDDNGIETSVGQGKDAKRLAQTWADRYNTRKRLARAGLEDEFPARCAWTLKDLCEADLQDAANRGLRTALPQFQGKASKRESHWQNLLRFFGEEAILDTISETAIRAYVSHRQKTVGPVPINRDLFGVLRPALRLARETEAANYRGDPFRALRKLNESRGKRRAIALSEPASRRLIRFCRRVHAPLGAWVELQLLTASRPGQRGVIQGGHLRYAAHKRGIPRSFPIAGRLAEVLAEPRAFSRHYWQLAVEQFRRPALHPHDLRHTALTIAGKQLGATLDSIRKLGGWTTTQMADDYLHPDARAIQPVQLTGADRRGKR